MQTVDERPITAERLPSRSESAVNGRTKKHGLNGVEPGLHASDRISGDNPQQINAVAALLRYKWAVMLPTVLGVIAGLIVYTQLPETYRSTTRLIIRNSVPAVLDQVSGDMVGGVPPIEVVQAQITSDNVIARAYTMDTMEAFRDRFESPADFASTSIKALELEPEVEDIRTAQSLVLLMHYEHTDDELCNRAVVSFSKSLQDYYADQIKDSRGGISEVISDALDKLIPNLTRLEAEYVAFRKNSDLTWDKDQRAVNPYRERQLYLVSIQSEMEEKARQLATELAMVNALKKQKLEDPIFALKTIGQLLDKKLAIPLEEASRARLGEGDLQLMNIKLEQDLVPVMIEKFKLDSELGADHPSVKDASIRLEMLQTELRGLVEKESARIRELLDESGGEAELAKKAEEAVGSVVLAMQAELELVERRVDDLRKQVIEEKANAAAIAADEQKDIAMRHGMERLRGLIDSLTEQIQKLDANQQQGGIVAEELMEPTPGYKVGPRSLICVGLGTMAGLALGCCIALILEANANTFRNPDDVGIILGVPVLTHLPFFKGKQNKKLRKADYKYAHLDPHLAVVHSPTSVPAEAVRSCRTSVFFELGSGGGKILQLTSPLPGDGKSTISENLAAAISQSGKSVLVIDCDLRRPRIGENFSVADRTGLTNVLNGECEAEEAIHESGVENLCVMPSGPIPVNPAEALSLPEMGDLLEYLRGKYDFIILDTPPLLVVTDASIIANYADGVILALRIRRKSKPNAKEAMSILRSVHANVLGVIVNNSDEATTSDGYAGRGYYRYGKYTDHYRRSSKLETAPEPFTVEGRTKATAASLSQVSEPSSVSTVSEQRPSSPASEQRPASPGSKSRPAKAHRGIDIASPINDETDSDSDS